MKILPPPHPSPVRRCHSPFWEISFANPSPTSPSFWKMILRACNLLKLYTVPTKPIDNWPWTFAICHVYKYTHTMVVGWKKNSENIARFSHYMFSHYMLTTFSNTAVIILLNQSRIIYYFILSLTLTIRYQFWQISWVRLFGIKG